MSCGRASSSRAGGPAGSADARQAVEAEALINSAEWRSLWRGKRLMNRVDLTLVPSKEQMKDSVAPLGKFDRSVSLLPWGFNEEDLVTSFLDRAFAILEATTTDYEVVFVDDCSTDRTAELVAAYAAREPRLKLIRHDRNYNVGIALRTAVAHASKDFLFWETVD